MSAPPPYIPAVAVNERNMLEWHYLLQGPPDTPYVGGWYVGKLRYPVRAACPHAKTCVEPTLLQYSCSHRFSAPP
jgi:hypothetical protein